jgi:undecaprenyl-diphosphatase
MGLIQQLNHLDQHLFLLLNGWHNTYFDYVMMVFTSEVFWVPLYVITAVVIGRTYGKNAVLIFVAAGVLILCTDQFAGIFKHSIQRLRPSHDPQLSVLTHIFNNYKGGLYSFYSAHSSNAFGYATFTILIFRNRIYTFFIIPWALLVAYTRIYLGLHYPGDIFCGAIAGIAIAIGVYKLMLLTTEKFFPNRQIQSSQLNNQETAFIASSGILMIVIALMIVNLLESRYLLIMN